MSSVTPAPFTGAARHSVVTVKALKRALKKAGLKTTGKKATLTRRARKARLMRGGVEGESSATNVPPNATNVPQTSPNATNVPANVPGSNGGRSRSRRR